MVQTYFKGLRFSTSVLILSTAKWQNFSWGDSAHTYLFHIGSLQQPKVQIIPKSNVVKKWVLLGLLTGIWVTVCLQEQKWLKNSHISNHSRIGHKAENLVHIAQPVHISASWRVSFPSDCLNLFRQLNRFLLIPDNYSGVSHLFLSFSSLGAFFAVQLPLVWEGFTVFIAFSGRKEV